MQTVWIMLGALSIGGIVWYLFDSWRKLNSVIDISELTLTNNVIDNALSKISEDLAYQHFKDDGRPIFTKNGNYRAAFNNEMRRVRSGLEKECFFEDRFSKDFCRFAWSKQSEIKLKDVKGLIIDYIEDHKNQADLSTESFQEENKPMNPGEFFLFRKRHVGDLVGVYVIYNSSKQKYYVGQAKRLLFRVNQHFTGHGNGDVYADYVYGDRFLISLMPLADSDYTDIDAFEKDMIQKYHAYENGYNRQRGNKKSIHRGE